MHLGRLAGRIGCSLGAVGLIAASASCDRGESKNADVVVSDQNSVANVIPASPQQCALTSIRQFPLDTGLYELEDFRAASLSEGGTLALASSTSVLLVDSAGNLLKRFGRRGEGPGEFRKISRLWWAGTDTLVAGDFRPWRVQYFDIDGKLVRGVTPQPIISNNPVSVSRLDDGTFLLAEKVGIKTRQAHRDSIAVKLVSAVGVAMKEFGRFPNQTLIQINPDVGQNSYVSKLFEPVTSVNAAGNWYVIGDQSKNELTRVNLSGERNAFRWAFADRARDRTVRASDIKAYREELEGTRTPQNSSSIDEVVSEKRPISAEFPAFSNLWVTPSGSVWIQLFRRPGDERRELLKFTSDGKFSCAMSLDVADYIAQLSDREMLIHTTDESSVGVLKRIAIKTP